MTPDLSTRRAGAAATVVGVVALVAYAVLGTGEDGLPAGRLSLAALLIIVGVGLRHERAPAWGRFVAGLLASLVAADLVLSYLA